jgi:hypothetical protein
MQTDARAKLPCVYVHIVHFVHGMHNKCNIFNKELYKTIQNELIQRMHKTYIKYLTALTSQSSTLEDSILSISTP